MLSFVDISKNTNKYYKMQLLESDDMNYPEYWLYRSWGRVSIPNINQSKCRYENLDDARNKFEEIFLDKTGNLFYAPQFEKKPKKYYKHDIDCGDMTEIRSLIDSEWASDVESKLEERVQNLIKLMFNEKMMKDTMLGFDLDAQILPCGKVSNKQICSAMVVLSHINELIEENSMPIKFVEASNIFYTLIPHNFGDQRPTIINSRRLVEQKNEMIEYLLNLKLNHDVVQKRNTENTNPVDAAYLQLGTDLRSLNQTEPEYKMIEEYVKNTHSPHHDQWKSLEIKNIFQVKRHSEEERFKPFRNCYNRQLLWHGSRTTNIAGILQNGLRIAPPEAPSTGHMFGKGVYFTDMFSKSAQYCQTTKENNTGVLLLCQVALGNTLDLKESKCITALPPGKDSVKGIGTTYPNPDKALTRADGVIVPLGELMVIDAHNSSIELCNNEYVVYNAAQIKCEYLVQIKFHY